MGTESISAESRSIVRSNSDTQAERFKLLKAELDSRVQARIAKGYWEAREVEASNSDLFLAISWRGSDRFWKALAWQKKLAAFEKARSALPADSRPDRNVELKTAARALNDRFLPKHAGPYAMELFVFYKTSNLAPAALVQMAPGCVQAFIEAPLHTYFLIGRHQAAVDKGEKLQFTGFAADRDTPRDAAGLCALVLKKIFPKEPPVVEPDEPRRCWPCYLLGGLALALIVAAACVLVVPSWRDWAFRQLDIGRQSQLDELGGEVAALRARYDSLEAEVDELTQDLPPDGPVDQAGNAAQVASIELELDALAARLAAHGHPVADRGVPLGLAPCLPVVSTGSANGGAPGYLLDLTLSAEGIGVAEPRGVYAWSTEDRLDPDFPTALQLPGRTLSSAEFDAFAAPISQQARRANCAHYVLLREGEGGGRASYIGQRNAVERHFYIYRPHP